MLTEEEIELYFLKSIFIRGKAYQREGLVDNNEGKYRWRNNGNLWQGEQILLAYVQGKEKYTVTMPVYEGELEEESLDEAICSCPHFSVSMNSCKHVVAVALDYVGQESEEDDNEESNRYGKRLLQLYRRSESAKILMGDIALKPRIFDVTGEYPYISFTIGREKMYVVKRIDHFLDHLEEQKVVGYGKELEFQHQLHRFDDISQHLIRIIQGQNNQEQMYYQERSTAHLTHGSRGVRMDSNSFRLFFSLFQGQLVEIEKWHSKTVLFEQGEPELTVRVQKKGTGATVSLEGDGKLVFFGNEFGLYVLNNTSFYQCSLEFSRKIAPLSDFYQQGIYVSEQDLPTLCSVVLAEIQDIVETQDEAGICEQYIPDQCTTRFYFDLQKDVGVVAQVKFLYGDIEVDEIASGEQLAKIRQNVQEEAWGLSRLKEEFQTQKYKQSGHLYLLKGDEEEFLTSGMEQYRQYGQVFVSQTLSGMFIDTKSKPTLGISVSDGLLTLDMDTGEFPTEELEELYHSFLRKKKYHKLKDGRILFLNGSGFEKTAEIVHMLQLSSKELKGNQIQLPAYRGLYLDQVLDGNDMVQSVKNQTFRRMMKDFKGVEDSDYQPSPLLKTTLRPYQVLGFQWMKTLEQYGFGGILADEMGLGKTVQVITYLLSLEGKKQEQPSIIICPASLLFNWKDELSRFAPSLNVMVILGNAKERKEQILEGGEASVWVTSYDLIKRDREHYKSKKFYACVLDEAQNIKNQGTLVSKTVKGISCAQRFVLTGTPIENRLSELWNLFDFLMPGYLFTHNAFVSKLEKPIVQSGEVMARRQLNLLVQPFIMRRLKKDVLKELPDKMEYVRKIHLSEQERKVYAAAMLRVKSEASGTQNKLQILALLTHLRQLCCDPHLCFDNYEGENSKLDACLELCQTMVANGHKILLFSQFTTMLDRIRERLNLDGIRNLTIEGSTAKEKRAKYVKEFQNGQADVFLISLKAGGTGLNLTNADVVIHYDPWWNQAAQNQATDRAHRMGQQQHVQVYKLIAQGTIEEKILELQEKKASLMEAVMEEAGDEPLSREDILDLLE